MNIKVINIVNHPPAYDGHRGRPRPEINWDTPNGSWVGIWGYEWHDIIGNNVLALADDIEYEVWQPDQRADKIYEHTFKSGLVHKLFPAVDKRFIHGLHSREDIYSELLMIELEREVNSRQPIVIHVNAGFRYINIPILKKYYKKVPIVGQFFTNSSSIFNIQKTKNPIKLLNAYKKQWELFKYYKMLKYIIPSVREGTEFFERKFGTKVFNRDFANFGNSLDGWTINSSKEEVRKKLNIPPDKFIFFSSSRLVPVKQVDKLIIALSNLDSENFKCYISGRGTEEYEAYLKKMLIDYGLENNVKFIGYVDFAILKDYFQAADLLVSTSKQDAGPAAPFLAAAMETPAFLTNTGIASEFFKDNEVGIIVPTDDYKVWVSELNKMMQGKKVTIPNKEKLVAFGDWEKVSNYYYNIYKTILKN
ncbi:MAG: glycosyltransferase [Bacteroidota bacterium]